MIFYSVIINKAPPDLMVCFSVKKLLNAKQTKKRTKYKITPCLISPTAVLIIKKKKGSGLQIAAPTCKFKFKLNNLVVVKYLQKQIYHTLSHHFFPNCAMLRGMWNQQLQKKRKEKKKRKENEAKVSHASFIDNLRSRSGGAIHQSSVNLFQSFTAVAFGLVRTQNIMVGLTPSSVSGLKDQGLINRAINGLTSPTNCVHALMPVCGCMDAVCSSL